MVTLQASGQDLVFEVWAEPPLIYLDHWAIRRLSSEPAFNARFTTAFRNRGTVMFSLMNVVEIEEAVFTLAAEPFDAKEFRSQMLAAFGNKETTIKWLRQRPSHHHQRPSAPRVIAATATGWSSA